MGPFAPALFFAYILLISRMAGIRAVFQYHGAEHKAINTLEAGLPLTRENALKASRIHPRCGTSFIVVVMAVDFLICLMLPRPVWFWDSAHLAVMPPVAGIAYEVIKFAGKYRSNPIVMAAFAPGMWSQYLTTREPTPEQVDVALSSLYAVLEAEGASRVYSGTRRTACCTRPGGTCGRNRVAPHIRIQIDKINRFSRLTRLSLIDAAQLHPTCFIAIWGSGLYRKCWLKKSRMS